MLDLDDNPPIIWFNKQKFVCGNGQGSGCEIADLAANEAVWYIGRCKSRAEKRLAFDLMRRGIPYYLPIIKKRAKASNRQWRTTLLPLFPTFIFIAVDPGRILNPNEYLSYAFRVREDWKLVKELTDLKAEIDAGRLSCLQQLREGQRYRVTDGAFRDCEGELDHVDYRGRFGFLRTFLGELRIEAEALELVA
jgi:hypothetical protein